MPHLSSRSFRRIAREIRLSQVIRVTIYHTSALRELLLATQTRDYICMLVTSLGRYSKDVLVERCGWGAQILTLFIKTETSDFPTLFKTEISDSPTLFKTGSRFLRPRLNKLTFNQKSLSSFFVVQASGISANKKGYKFGFFYQFFKFMCMRFKFKCKSPFQTENPENHTLSGRTSPLRPYMGELPPPPPPG